MTGIRYGTKIYTRSVNLSWYHEDRSRFGCKIVTTDDKLRERDQSDFELLLLGIPSDSKIQLTYALSKAI